MPAHLLTQESQTRSQSAAAPTAMGIQQQAQRLMEGGPWPRTAPLPHPVPPAVDQEGRTKPRRRRTRIKTRRGRTPWPTSLVVLARAWAASWRKMWADWWQAKTLELEVWSKREGRRRRAHLGGGRAAKTARLQPTPRRTLGRARPPLVASVSTEQGAVWAAVVEAALRAIPISTAPMWRSAWASCEPPCKARGNSSSPACSPPVTGNLSRRRWSSATSQMQRSAFGRSRSNSVGRQRGRASPMASSCRRRRRLAVPSWPIGLMSQRRSCPKTRRLPLTN